MRNFLLMLLVAILGESSWFDGVSEVLPDVRGSSKFQVIYDILHCFINA